jgi:hypothetical protein
LSSIAQFVSLVKSNVLTVPLPGGIYVRLWLGSMLFDLPKFHKFNSQQNG